jgi:Flp pilus assembly protein TadG
MVPVIGFGALAVDLGNLYAQRVKVQTAADAAALSLAQDCARGACTNLPAKAATWVTNNAAGATVSAVTTTTNSVTVTDASNQPSWLGRVLGATGSTVGARSTARWEAPTAGARALPIAFSWCEWQYQTGGGIPSGTTPRTIFLSKTSGAVDCTGPSHNVVPGGFGYLTTTGTSCTATTNGIGWGPSSTGNNPLPGCAPADLLALLGTTVLLPIFDDATGTGSGAQYHVYGYAAFKLTGYYLGGSFDPSPSPCSGNERCLRGYFTSLVTLSEDFPHSPTAPLLGAAVVRLVR